MRSTYFLGFIFTSKFLRTRPQVLPAAVVRWNRPLYDTSRIQSRKNELCKLRGTHALATYVCSCSHKRHVTRTAQQRSVDLAMGRRFYSKHEVTRNETHSTVASARSARSQVFCTTRKRRLSRRGRGVEDDRKQQLYWLLRQARAVKLCIPPGCRLSLTTLEKRSVWVIIEHARINYLLCISCSLAFTMMLSLSLSLSSWLRSRRSSRFCQQRIQTCTASDATQVHRELVNPFRQ